MNFIQNWSTKLKVGSERPRGWVVRCKTRSSGPQLRRLLQWALGVLRVPTDIKADPLDSWGSNKSWLLTVTIVALCGNRPVIPALRRLRQGEWQFKSGWLQKQDPISKMKPKQNEHFIPYVRYIILSVLSVLKSLQMRKLIVFLFLLFWASYCSPGWFELAI